MIIWLQFIACTLVIVYAGTKLSQYGDVIAEKTGLSRTWIGVVLLASVTSLPELMTGISSVAVFDLPNIAEGDVLVVEGTTDALDSLSDRQGFLVTGNLSVPKQQSGKVLIFK